MNPTCNAFARSCAFGVFLCCLAFDNGRLTKAEELSPRIVAVNKIWDQAPHNAFTDLVRWNDRFYCAFREGQGHAGDRGKLRIIESTDGSQWESTALLSMQEFDLRDAALSITPDHQLMVLGGAQRNANGARSTGTFVSFCKNGKNFTDPVLVTDPGRWLWRVTWFEEKAYGVSYGAPANRESSALLSSSDGLDFKSVTNSHLTAGGWPTEARLRFESDGTCYSLHRRDGQENSAYLGVANPPYADWNWKDLGVRIGGPNLLKLSNGRWIGVGRLYDGGARTSLFEVDVLEGKITPLLRLPSGGDTSYPGLVWHNDLLWVSYYSSHEGKTSVYLAKIQFPKPSSTLDVGNRLELFLDDAVIDEFNGAQLRLAHPRPEEIVLKFDEPWEGPFSGYITVLQDDSKFRMYYRGLPSAGRDGSDLETTCYAESDDGVHWIKPKLGQSQTNVVLRNQAPASHNFSPFLDTRPGVPTEEKYKALGGTSAGLIAFCSENGIDWKRIQESPVFTQGVFDSQNVAFYSASEQQYVCYFRTWTDGGYRGYRTISRTTSKDFINWAEPIAMSFGDTPNEHLYTNQTTPYFRAPHIYLGIAARFMPGRQVLSKQQANEIGVNPKYFGDISDAVLLSSRGGSSYDRTFMQSFIRPGLGIQNWVSRTNYPALGIVQTGDEELSIYVQKNYGQPSIHLRRYSLRLDGFASIHADFEPGEAKTKSLKFQPAKGDSKTQLHINVATSAVGGVRIEIQDKSGQPIPGFSLDECDEIIGDSIDRVVTWDGKSDVSTLANKAIQLRFWIKDGDVYSMQFR